MNHFAADSNRKDPAELLDMIGIGHWTWNLQTGEVIYSQAWARILGYTLEELEPTVKTWESMVLPEDLVYANQQINLYLEGKKSVYEAEFRMVCKDGSLIWAQDKGKVSEYDLQGHPLWFVGVLQNVTRLKDAELQLREKQETLDMAIAATELGTWDWDLSSNIIRYNNEYLKMLGYAQDDVSGSLEEWSLMNHPEDRVHAVQMLDDYLAGKNSKYECEVRMRHRDGHYIWTRDIGKIVAWDANHAPTRLIGGHLNIDARKRSEVQLTQAMERLEHNKFTLEQEIENRTKELVEQDQMLWTVNQVSRTLLALQPDESFDSVVQNCLRLLGESLNKNRVYIWKDRSNEAGQVCCTQIYEWVQDVVSIQGNEQYAELPYEGLPFFEEAISAGRCLNSLVQNLSPNERAVLEPQGIKTILIAPIAINGRRWGFIGVDNCENHRIFSSAEENMLFMSGSMLANAIQKMENQAAMWEMEERTQLMLNATPLCCNLWSRDLQNMSCNDEAVRLFALSSQEEYLERFDQLSPPCQPCGTPSGELAIHYLQQAFRDGYCRFEWMHQKLDGTPIPSEITLVRIRYKGDFIVAGYTRDLREHNAMLAELLTKENDLRAARDEALLSSKAKSNFLANMSHEIRTPMNVISGMAEIMLRDSPNEKLSEYAKSIKTACGSLLNIINDILDISKIESGKLEILPAEYTLASLLHDVITISRMRLGSKPLMLVTNIDSRLPANLIGDEIRLKQILINLMSNAIKFTSRGHITLKVSGTMKDNQVELSFSVTDTGSGIKEEDLQRLFVEFERVNTTKNRNIEGTGLGLAISKQLCEMMNGHIAVESVYGKGSTFTAVVPQTFHSYQAVAAVAEKKNVLLYEPRDVYRQSIAAGIENLGCVCVPCANQSELYDSISCMHYDHVLTTSLHLKKVKRFIQSHGLSAQLAVFADYAENIREKGVYVIVFPVNCLQLADLLNGKTSDDFYSSHQGGLRFTAPTARVLVVDDNPVNLRVAAGLMEPYAFAIDTAYNGLKAVEMVQENTYDLVFMDHMMPEMDGIDATIAIRKLPGDYFKKLPIIALTANALVGTREMFIQEGMNDFLAKPIELSKLAHVLAKWLPAEKLVQQEEAASTPTVPVLKLEIAGVDTHQGVLSMGGNTESYLQVLGVYLEDGLKKCNLLLQYATQQNISAFRTEVHALKSASASIGALSLSTMAAKLEAAAHNNDLAYIDGNIDELLTTYREILDSLRPVVALHAAQQDSTDALPAKAPCAHQLLSLLEELQTATELVSIAQIEAVMKLLETYAWPQAVSNELVALKSSLAVFDYDAVLERIARIRLL